jgi:tetratricopeptide (TPR) repeat protein
VGAADWAARVANEVEQASITGDINRMENAHDMVDRALVSFPDDPLLLHYQGFERYVEANLLEGINRRDEIPPLLERARAALEQSNSLRPLPETHALLAAVLGRMIGQTPSLASVLGPQAQQELQAARATGPNNPRVWLLQGISSIYTPAQYGGGLSVAESQLRQAIALFATDHPTPPYPSWGRAEAYAWLGQVMQKEGNKTEAAAAYDQALAVAPKYTWVKTVLLPSTRR